MAFAIPVIPEASVHALSMYQSFVLMLQVTPISEDDYFAKNPEFSAWLRDLQHIHFNELTAEASRDKFKVHAKSRSPDCSGFCLACGCPHLRHFSWSAAERFHA